MACSGRRSGFGWSVIKRGLANAVEDKAIIRRAAREARVHAAFLAFRLRNILCFGCIFLLRPDDDLVRVGTDQFGSAAAQQDRGQKENGEFFHGLRQECEESEEGQGAGGWLAGRTLEDGST